MLLDLRRKNEGNPFSTKIWVVGFYTDTLLTIILRNRAEYRLILSRRGPSRLKSDDIREIKQDNCFIIQQIDKKTRNILKSFCRHFFTSLFLPTYEATYIAGYLLPTDDRDREHHDHIWIVLQFVE